MKSKRLDLEGLYLLEPQVFEDERGFFFESFNQAKFEQAIGRKVTFVQDNHSRSIRGVLRGLHFQDPKPQGKLIRVTHGEVFDIAVDIRPGSSTFGKWIGNYLSAENKKQLWIPEGFAHGFQVTSDTAEVLYKVTEYHAPQFERCIVWNDPALGIEWPIKDEVILSSRDKRGESISSLL